MSSWVDMLVIALVGGAGTKVIEVVFTKPQKDKEIAQKAEDLERAKRRDNDELAAKIREELRKEREELRRDNETLRQKAQSAENAAAISGPHGSLAERVARLEQAKREHGRRLDDLEGLEHLVLGDERTEGSD